jgi:hypothetical protein
VSNESDMQLEKKWYYEQAAKRCVTALLRNNINAYYVSARDEARLRCFELIPEGATVGVGDSVTLYQIGIIKQLTNNSKYRVFNPLLRNEKGELVYGAGEVQEMMRKALLADVFLMGTNAITLDGKLVNTDAYGNRVGGLVFGPGKVIVVAGANKIVKNVDEGLRRIKDIAAPMNVKRHVLKHGLPERPCSQTGTCVDCRHPQRVCCFTVIVEYQRKPLEGSQPRINVILVGEELGI